MVKTLKKLNDRYLLGILVFILLFIGVSVATTFQDSPTVDEIPHIGAGFSYIAHGDYRMNPEHPPLIKWFAGVGTYARIGDQITPPDQPYSNLWHYEQHNFGRTVLFDQKQSAESVLLSSRLPIIIISSIMLLATFLVSRKIWGKLTGLVLCGLIVANPSFLAHAKLVTTDIAAMWGAFFMLIALVWWLKKPGSYKRSSISGLVAGLALLTKFSIIFAFGYALLVILFYIFIKPNFASRVLLRGAVAIAITFMTVYIAYIPASFSIKDSSWLDNTLQLTEKTKFAKSHIARLYSFAPTRPIALYGQGLARVQERYAMGDTTYLFGKNTLNKVWYYYPVVLAAKTPPALALITISTTILVAIALVKNWPKQWHKKIFRLLLDNPYDAVLIGFALIYAYIATCGSLNLGVRYLFPIFLPMFLLIARVFVFVWQRYATNWVRIPLCILAAGYLLTPALVYPNYIAYTNSLFGGTSSAYTKFNDSNVDWGQDHQRLARWLSTQPQIKTLYMSSFGWDDWRYYFCKYDQSNQPCESSKYIWWSPSMGAPKKDSYFAINVTPYAYNIDKLDFISDKKPFAVINGSILVFEL